MSEQTTTTETKDTEKNKGWLKTFCWVMIGVIIGIALSFAIFTATAGNAAKQATENLTSEATTEITTEESGDALGISTYEYEHNVLTGDELDNASAEIVKYIDSLKSRSIYTQLQIDNDTYESYMYNKNGECFAQTSDGAYAEVFRNDGQAIKYSESNSAVAFGKDIEVLTIMENAVTAAKNKVNGAQMFEMVPASDEATAKEYRVDLVGEEAVKACYNADDEDFANIMYENLIETAGEDWEPHLIMVFIVDDSLADTDDNKILMYCLYVADNTEYTNWLMQGYAHVDDWKLSDDWYTTDWSNIDTDTYDEMTSELTSNLQSILDKYFEENGIELETTEEPTEVENETLSDISLELENEIEVTETEKIESSVETSEN